MGGFWKNRWRTCFIVAIVSLMVTSSLGEDQPAAESVVISARGSVVDPEGQPVGGARVVLREWSNLRKSENPFLETAQDILAETTTDAEGLFHFANVPSRPFERFNERAPWDLVAIVDGFGMAWAHLKQAVSDKPVILTLHHEKQLEGSLVDSGGKPIADCIVKVSSIASPSAEWEGLLRFSELGYLNLGSSEFAPELLTDEKGRFILSGLPMGYRVTLTTKHPKYVGKWFYVSTTEEDLPYITKPSSDGQMEQEPVLQSGFTQQLEIGRVVRGRTIYADTGEPAPGVRVSLTWKNQGYFRTADEDGRYAFTGLPGSQYTLGVSSESPRYLASQTLIHFSPQQHEREITVRVMPGEIARGMVVDEETKSGVPGVWVSYLSGEEQGNGYRSRGASTDEFGRFEVRVAPGAGILRVGNNAESHATHDVPDFRRWYNKKHISPGHSTEINITAGEPLENVRLTVSRGLVVRGRFVDDQGEPVAGAIVRPAGRSSHPIYKASVLTDEQGQFELSGFPPHKELSIQALHESRGLLGMAHVLADDAAGSMRVVELNPITMRGTASVAGQLLGDGEPLSDIRINLYVHTPIGGNRLSSQSVGSTTTNMEGRFTFSAAPAGVNLNINSHAEGYSMFNESVVLKSGESRELPATNLKSLGSFVSGIVVDPTGKPLAGVSVDALARDYSVQFGYRRGGPTITGEDGRFRIDGLPNMPLGLIAHIRPTGKKQGGHIRFPARIDANPGDTDVRIILDPKLQRPLP